jgi:hypothetical protein
VLLATCGVLGTKASLAQTNYPKDEIFGGYSVLFPNGWEELNYKADTIPNAFAASNTWYFCKICNLGFILDGSGHFKGGTTPPNLDNGSDNSTGVGYALAGLQYKWHMERVSPFLRFLIGAANISPDCCHGTQWRFAAGGGGGVDITLSRRFSWRLIQADYLYSSYPHIYASNHSEGWNSVRLATGIVIALGDKSECNPQPVACAVTASSPTEVWIGEPVKFNVAGSNFNPKHTVQYAWKSTGGSMATANASAVSIDTTGLAAGPYTASATVSDPKVKGAVAPCSAVFLVKEHPKPVGPTVKCVPPDTTINAGETATLSMVATNPDNRPLTYKWTTTSGQLEAGGDSARMTPTNNDAGSTITVTGTVADDRSLSDSCRITVNVPKLPPPCVKLIDWGECTFEKDPRRPWRVDNVCKDILDQLALKLQGTPNGTLVIVGYADDKESKKSPTLSAQRAANVEYYLVTDGPNKLDAARIKADDGGVQGKTTHFYFVPDGTLCDGQTNLGTAVDQGKVKGQPRGGTHHAKKAAAPVKGD